MTATTDIFTELREEIRLVKFPQPAATTTTKRTKSVTIVMPDGKRVKQFKKDDEDLVPLSLAFEGKSKKGDVYVRADGKRVRLVKKKDKKRKERQQKEAKRQLIECDWSEMSWEEAEAEQDRIVRMSWQKGVVSKKASDASSVVSDETCSTTEAETLSVDTEDNMDQDLGGWDVESSASSAEDEEGDDHVDDDEMNAFLASLSESEQEQEEEEEDKPEERLSSVQRMALKSQEALAKADYMRRLSELANEMGNLKQERFRYVSMPRHYTQ